jgi:tetratricopeptide (TPR) repeat protein
MVALLSPHPLKPTRSTLSPASRPRVRHRSLSALLLPIACSASLPVAGALPEEVFERAAPSVVVVERLDAAGKRNGFASGVVVGPDRVVTSCHAVTSTAAIQVRVRGTRLPTRLEYADVERDLCQLEVDDLNRKAVRIVAATQLKVGQRVYAIGTPKGLELTLSEGLISSLRPRARSFVIQTSAPMSHGSSGGGLFDDEGRLVGIAAFQYARGQNLNFAVPASWVPELAVRAKASWAKAGLAATAEQPLGARLLALMDIGNYEAALQVAREWTQAAPTDALPRHALGRVYTGLKRPDEAVMALRSATKLKPDFIRAWLDLGTAYASAGDDENALMAYGEALRVDGQSPEARHGRGVALTALHRYEEAVEELHRAIDIDQTYDSAWEALAVAHATEGRPDLAAAACRKGLKLNPQSSLLWYQFGLVQAQRGQAVQAIQAYEEALRLQPDYLAAVYDLGVLYSQQGERAKAREIYEKLRALDTDSAEQFSVHYLSE